MGGWLAGGRAAAHSVPLQPSEASRKERVSVVEARRVRKVARESVRLAGLAGAYTDV